MIQLKSQNNFFDIMVMKLYFEILFLNSIHRAKCTDAILPLSVFSRETPVRLTANGMNVDAIKIELRLL